jgi:hypothetical protein
MNLTKEKIEELKKAHPEGVYEGEMTFTDAEDKFHKVEFVFRVPLVADIESHNKSAQKNPIVANINLIQSLIVHPEPASVIDAIREYPIAYGRFVDEVVAPFFGGNTTSRKTKI